MKKITYLFLLSTVFLAGCPKHEVIPAPEKKVALSAHFTGKINGTDVEFTENVSGYYLDATKSKLILPNATSTAVYYSEMRSTKTSTAIKIGMGNVQWDASLSPDPTLTIFNDFFNLPANKTPAYMADADNGFEVTYKDASSRVWKSAAGTVEFFNVTQDSDDSGDYSKFVCNFSCSVQYNQGDTLLLTLPIDNASFTGWFKR